MSWRDESILVEKAPVAPADVPAPTPPVPAAAPGSQAPASYVQPKGTPSPAPVPAPSKGGDWRSEAKVVRSGAEPPRIYPLEGLTPQETMANRKRIGEAERQRRITRVAPAPSNLRPGMTTPPEAKPEEISVGSAIKHGVGGFLRSSLESGAAALVAHETTKVGAWDSTWDSGQRLQAGLAGSGGRATPGSPEEYASRGTDYAASQPQSLKGKELRDFFDNSIADAFYNHNSLVKDTVKAGKEVAVLPAKLPGEDIMTAIFGRPKGEEILDKYEPKKKARRNTDLPPGMFGPDREKHGNPDWGAWRRAGNPDMTDWEKAGKPQNVNRWLRKLAGEEKPSERIIEKLTETNVKWHRLAEKHADVLARDPKAFKALPDMQAYFAERDKLNADLKAALTAELSQRGQVAVNESTAFDDWKLAEAPKDVMGWMLSQQAEAGRESRRLPDDYQATSRLAPRWAKYSDALMDGIAEIVANNPFMQAPDVNTAADILTNPNALFDNVGAMLPYMGAIMAATMLGGPAAGFIVGAIIEGHQGYRESKADLQQIIEERRASGDFQGAADLQNVSEDHSQAAGAIKGTVNALIENAQIDGMLKFGSSLGKKIAVGKASKTMMMLLGVGRTVKHAATEALEEMTQGASGDIISGLVYNKKIDPKQFVKQRTIEGILGAVAYVPGGLIKAGIHALKAKPAEARNQREQAARQRFEDGHWMWIIKQGKLKAANEQVQKALEAGGTPSKANAEVLAFDARTGMPPIAAQEAAYSRSNRVIDAAVKAGEIDVVEATPEAEAEPSIFDSTKAYPVAKLSQEARAAAGLDADAEPVAADPDALMAESTRLWEIYRADETPENRQAWLAASDKLNAALDAKDADRGRASAPKDPVAAAAEKVAEAVNAPNPLVERIADKMATKAQLEQTRQINAALAQSYELAGQLNVVAPDSQFQTDNAELLSQVAQAVEARDVAAVRQLAPKLEHELKRYAQKKQKWQAKQAKQAARKARRQGKPVQESAKPAKIAPPTAQEASQAPAGPAGDAQRLGITYNGPQEVKGEVRGHMFTDTRNGAETTFMTKPGEDVETALKAARARFDASRAAAKPAAANKYAEKGRADYEGGKHTVRDMQMTYDGLLRKEASGAAPKGAAADYQAAYREAQDVAVKARVQAAAKPKKTSAKVKPLQQVINILTKGNRRRRDLIRLIAGIRTLATEVDEKIARGDLRAEDREEHIKKTLRDHGLSEDYAAEDITVQGANRGIGMGAVTDIYDGSATAHDVMHEVIERGLREELGTNLDGEDDVNRLRKEVASTKGLSAYDNTKNNLEWLADFLTDWLLKSDRNSTTGTLLRRAAANHFRETRLGAFAEWMRALYKELLTRVRALQHAVRRGDLSPKAISLANKLQGVALTSRSMASHMEQNTSQISVAPGEARATINREAPGRSTVRARRGSAGSADPHRVATPGASSMSPGTNTVVTNSDTGAQVVYPPNPEVTYSIDVQPALEEDLETLLVNSGKTKSEARRIMRNNREAIDYIGQVANKAGIELAAAYEAGFEPRIPKTQPPTSRRHLLARTRQRKDRFKVNISAIADNQDYYWSFDVTGICTQRVNATKHINAVVAALSDLGPEAGGATMNEVEREIVLAALVQFGMLRPCTACYVESRRNLKSSLVDKLTRFMTGELNRGDKIESMKKPEVIAARKDYKGVKREDFDLAVFNDKIAWDLAFRQDGADGREKHHMHTSINGKPLLKLYKMIDAYANANSAAVFGTKSYAGEYRNMTGSDVQWQKHYGGFRMFSISDFLFEHAVDIMQAITDLSTKLAWAHIYSKVPNTYRLLKDTGLKGNLSIIPWVHKDGTVGEWTGQSFPFDLAKTIARDPSNKDWGVICIGTTDEVIAWAMKQDWIHYIIPYHRSGMYTQQFESMAQKQGWFNYEPEQRVKIVDQEKYNKWIEEFVAEHPEHTKDPHWKLHWWLQGRGMTDAQIVEGALAQAEKYGFELPFERFFYNKDGSLNPAAAKLIKDYARTDTPQVPVKPNFDVETVKKMADEWVAIKKSDDAPPSKRLVEFAVQQIREARRLIAEDPAKEREIWMASADKMGEYASNYMQMIYGGSGLTNESGEVTPIVPPGPAAARPLTDQEIHNLETVGRARFARTPHIAEKAWRQDVVNQYGAEAEPFLDELWETVQSGTPFMRSEATVARYRKTAKKYESAIESAGRALYAPRMRTTLWYKAMTDKFGRAVQPLLQPLMQRILAENAEGIASDIYREGMSRDDFVKAVVAKLGTPAKAVASKVFSSIALGKPMPSESLAAPNISDTTYQIRVLGATLEESPYTRKYLSSFNISSPEDDYLTVTMRPLKRPFSPQQYIAIDVSVPEPTAMTGAVLRDIVSSDWWKTLDLDRIEGSSGGILDLLSAATGKDYTDKPDTAKPMPKKLYQVWVKGHRTGSIKFLSGVFEDRGKAVAYAKRQEWQGKVTVKGLAGENTRKKALEMLKAGMDRNALVETDLEYADIGPMLNQFKTPLPKGIKVHQSEWLAAVRAGYGEQGVKETFERIRDGIMATLQPLVDKNLLDEVSSYRIPEKPGDKHHPAGTIARSPQRQAEVDRLDKKDTTYQVRPLPPNAQTESPAFKKWFKDSKVVDEKGQPKVVYHGSFSVGQVEAFDPEQGSSFGGAFNKLGTWHTDNATMASQYSVRITENGKVSGGTYPSYLSLENPLVFETDEESDAWQQFVDFWLESVEHLTGKKYAAVYDAKDIDPSLVRDYLVAEGHDGVILKDTAADATLDTRDDAPATNTMYLTLRPEQIKSATGNRGTFDPENPDITYGIRPLPGKKPKPKPKPSPVAEEPTPAPAPAALSSVEAMPGYYGIGEGTGEYDTTRLAERAIRDAAANAFPAAEGGESVYETQTHEQWIEAAISLPHDQAERIAFGEEEPPQGVKLAAVYEVVKWRIVASWDKNNQAESLAKFDKLKASPVGKTLSMMGQEIAAAGIRNPLDPFAAVAMIESAGLDAAHRRHDGIDYDAVRDLRDRLAEAERLRDEAVEKLRKELKAKTMAIADEELEQAPPPRRSRPKTGVEQNTRYTVEGWKQIKADLFADLRQAHDISHVAPLMAKAVKALTYAAGMYLEAGGRSASTWAKKMLVELKDLPIDIKPHLQEAWLAAKAEAREGLKTEAAHRVADVMERDGGSIANAMDAARDLYRMAIEAGIQGIEERLAAVAREIQAVTGAEVDIEAVRDAVSGYGRWFEDPQDAISVELRDNMAQHRELGKLRDMARRIKPRPTGRLRDKPSQAVRDLQKQVADEKKRHADAEWMEGEGERALQSYWDARRATLENAIADLDEQIKNRERMVREDTPRGKTPDDVKALIALRDARKKELDIVAPRKPIPMEKRIARAMKYYERRNQQLHDRLASGDFEKKAAQPTWKDAPDSKAKRDAMRAKRAADEIAKQLRSVAGMKVSPEEAATLVDMSRQAMAAKQAMEDSNNRREPGKDRPTGEELAYGVAAVRFAEYAAALRHRAERFTLEELVRHPIQSGVLATLGTVSRISISMKAAWDNSYHFRQGLKILLAGDAWDLVTAGPRALAGVGHKGPRYVWTKTFLRSWKILWDTYAGRHVTEALHAEAVSDPNHDLHGKMHLAVDGLEEAFPLQGRWVSKVTRWATNPSSGILGKVAKIALTLPITTYDASAAMFTGSAQYSRRLWANRLIAMARNAGVDLNDKQSIESLGVIANAITSRGRMRENVVVSSLLWAPRMLKGNVDFLTAHVLHDYVVLARKPGERITPWARRQAAFDLLKVLAGISGILLIAKAADPESVELDPTSSDFGKIRVGSTRFDVTGGMASILTLLGRLYFWQSKSSSTGEIKNLNAGGPYSKNLFDVTMDYLKNKVNPLTGAAIGWLENEDRNKPWIEGHPQAPDLESTVTNLILPLPYRNAQELLSDPDAAPFLLGLIADQLGVSQGTYPQEMPPEAGRILTAVNANAAIAETAKRAKKVLDPADVVKAARLTGVKTILTAIRKGVIAGEIPRDEGFARMEQISRSTILGKPAFSEQVPQTRQEAIFALRDIYLEQAEGNNIPTTRMVQAAEDLGLKGEKIRRAGESAARQFYSTRFLHAIRTGDAAAAKLYYARRIKLTVSVYDQQTQFKATMKGSELPAADQSELWRRFREAANQ